MIQVAVRLSPDSPAVQSSDVDDDDLDHRQKVNRRHGIRTRDVGYEQLWNAGKDDIVRNFSFLTDDCVETEHVLLT